MFFVEICVNSSFILFYFILFLVSVLNIFQSWFLSESNVGFLSDIILFINSIFLFSPCANIFCGVRMCGVSIIITLRVSSCFSVFSVSVIELGVWLFWFPIYLLGCFPYFKVRKSTFLCYRPNLISESLACRLKSSAFFPDFYHSFSISSLCMNTATRVQILNETDCISHRTNTLGKGMNPIILPPAMGK